MKRPLWFRITKFALGTAPAWLAGFLTLFGLVLGAGIKNDRIADVALSLYPRYELAVRGFEILQDAKYPLPMSEGGASRNVGVLEITHPSWSVLLDFLKSEVAVRKSERNEPLPVASLAEKDGKAAAPKDSPPPPINFDRVKTIIALRMDVISAGSKPLAPPFSLNVLWPVPVGRRVYEFLSFEEFRLDLRATMLAEVESVALWIAVIAFLAELPAILLKKILQKLEVRYFGAGTTSI